MVVGLLSVHLEGLHDLHDLGGERDGGSGLVCRIEGVLQVLDVQLDPEPWLVVSSRTMGALALRTVLPARPPLMALKTRSGSTPALVARTNASDMAAMLSATMI